MDSDYSKEIYDKLSRSQKRSVEIVLKDNTKLEGVLAGFFHGDTDSGEPFIARWHFIPEPDLPNYHSMPDELKSGEGFIIRQEDIRMVKFRDDE